MLQKVHVLEWILSHEFFFLVCVFLGFWELGPPALTSFFLRPPGVFPKTHELVDMAVEAHREEQRAEGVHIGPLASWTMEEVGIGTRDRMK